MLGEIEINHPVSLIMLANNIQSYSRDLVWNVRPLDWQLVFYRYSEQFEVNSSDLLIGGGNNQVVFPTNSVNL